MKENGTDYKSLYEKTISKLKIAKKNIGCYTFSSVIDKAIPEIAESEDDWIAWLEKQGSNLVENGYTNNKDINKYADNYSHEIWHKLMDNFKNIKDYYIGCNDVSDIVLNAIIDAYNWLERQGELKKKHNEIYETIKEKSYKEGVEDGILIGTKIQEPTIGIVEEENSLLEKFKQAVYDCAWGKVTCKKEGETKEEYANRWAEHFLLMVRDWADDYIEFTIQQKLRNCFEKGKTKTDIIEKQGEQEPADKVEPKFNVGDWLVCCNYEPEQIIGIKNDMYEMSNGDIRPINMINNNHNIRLWTIQDSKDGDVLANNGNIILFKEISNSARKDYKYIKSHCLVLAHGLDFYTGGSYNLDDGFHPATQEQRDLLFTKMKEAGYEWDAEKKELRKIEQKPVWNEEDDIEISVLINALGEFETYRGDFTKEKNWLKTLKERVQPKQELSETAG